MSQIEKFKDLNSRRNDISKEMKSIAKESFDEGCKNLFDKYPELSDFSWTQFTPWFNDGDSCVFGVDVDNLEINSWNPNDSYYEEEDNEETEDENVSKANFKKIQPDISSFLSIFSDEIFLDMFGDHAKIVVDRKGYEVEEYEHD